MSALLYAITGVVVLLAASRVTRLSRGAAAALLLFPLVLTARALFTGDVYGPLDLAYTSEPMASVADAAGVGAVANPSISDTYAEFFPWNDALRRTLRRGEWPLWNPYELSGTPLAGAAQVAPYHPITIVGLLLPISSYFGFAAAMLYLAAVASAFLLARELTESEAAALFAAAGWMASTHLIFFAGTAMANAVSVTPLVLVGARRIVHAPDRRSAAILAVALLLLILSGHPETVLHVVFLAVVYFAFLFATAPQKRAATLASGFAAGVSALLLSAFFLLPHLDAIQQSEEYLHRALGYRQTSSTPAQMTHRLKANFFPFLEGEAGIEEPVHSPQVRHGWLATAYAGALLFPAVILGLMRGRERWFWAAVIVWGLGSGIAAPGFTNLFNALPGFDIAVNDRMIVFATLGMCMLAAQGLPAADRSAATVFAAVAVAIALAAMALPTSVGADYRFTGALRAIVPIILGAGVIAVLPQRVGAAVLVGLLMVQRGGETASLQPAVPARAFYPPFPGLKLMRSSEPFRIVATGTMLPPALSTHYGLEDVRGFQAVTFARYDQTYPLWSKRQPVWSNRVDDLNAPILSAMNVRFALIAPELTLPPHWRRTGRFAAYDVAENTAVLPRAWVPNNVHRGQDTLRILGTIRDFGMESTIEGGKAGRFANGPGRVSLEGRGSTLRLHATMQREGWVIVSNAAWRGWRARSGGRDLPIAFANHAFLGIHLPAGTHEIELTYRPRSFVIGSAISIVTALLIALAYSGIPSSAMTFFMSFQTSFFAAGVRRR